MLGKIFPAVLCGLIPIEHRAGLCVLHYGGHQIGHMGKFGLGLLNVPGQRVKTLCGGIGLCSQIVIFKELVLFQILQRSRHLFKVIHLGPAFIGRAFMLLWFLATGGDGHRLIFGGCDEVGAYMELTLWHNTAHAESFQFYLSDYPCPGYAE